MTISLIKKITSIVLEMVDNSDYVEDCKFNGNVAYRLFWNTEYDMV